MKLLRKFRALLRKEKLDAEMSEEMRAHLDLLAAENEKHGLSAEEARYAARRSFGGVEQIKERAREQHALVWLEQMLQDLRYAARALRRTPSFTLAAVLTLALGIGVNAALFIVYNSVALRSLSVREPETLVKILGGETRGGVFLPNFSYPDYLDYRDGNRSLVSLAAISEGRAFLGEEIANAASDSLFNAREPGALAVQFVSNNYFAVLGAEMALGRVFLPEENRAPGAGAVAILSHLFWQTHFHGDPTVLGRTISLGRSSYTIIGVTRQDFTGHQPAPPAMWIPLMMWAKAADFENRDLAAFRLIGRLRPGVTEEQSKADFDLITRRIASAHPRRESRNSVRLERGMQLAHIPLNAFTLAATTPLVLGFVLVLAIACTNVANLLLARGVARQREIGVRLALGASRARIIRQLLAENLLLAAIAAVAGVVFAYWTLQLLRSALLASLPPDLLASARAFQFLSMGVDLRVLAFAVFLAGVAALSAGLMPALQAVRADLISAVKNEGSAFGRRLSGSRVRDVLVVIQVAVCVTLLSCAGLLVRNTIRLRNIDPGYDPGALFAVRQRGADENGTASDALRRQQAEMLRSMPGVAAACQLFGPIVGDGSFLTPVKKTADGAVSAEANFLFVSPEFFETFSIPLRRGRIFDWTEIGAEARTVVVSEGLARRLWPDENALGRTLAIGDAAFAFPRRVRGSEYHDYSVVGVVREVRTGLWDSAPGSVYLPLTSSVGARGELFIRPSSTSANALADIARLAEAQGRTLQFSPVLGDAFQVQKLPFRWLAALSGILGALALAMALVGLCGVIAFGVKQRVREIGVRMALGATAEKIVGLFVRQGMRLVAMGVGLGLGSGALFALLLKKVLVGLPDTFDPVAFGGVALVFTTVALFACWLPARRAAKVDPMVALRAE